MNQQEKEMVKKLDKFEEYKKELVKCKDLECLKNTFLKIDKSLITTIHYSDL